MGRDELIKIVDRILRVQGTEEELNILMGKFLASVPDPEALRFFSDPQYGCYTATEIVDAALDHKSIILGGP